MKNKVILILILYSYSYLFGWYSIAECAKHCSLCYNETECYECTQGYFITENAECQSEWV